MSKNRRVGDRTSFQIKEKFTHIETLEEIKTTPQMLNFINEQINNDKFVHAILTLIYDKLHKDEIGEEIGKLEKKMEKMFLDLGKKIDNAKLIVEDNNIQKNVDNQVEKREIIIDDEEDEEMLATLEDQFQ